MMVRLYSCPTIACSSRQVRRLQGDVLKRGDHGWGMIRTSIHMHMCNGPRRYMSNCKLDTIIHHMKDSSKL